MTSYEQQHPIMQYPAQPWQKLMFKSPILLWRLGLGPLFGPIILMLSHTGRKSGLVRRTALEYHVLDGRIYLVAAFGERAQWYQNVLTDPYVTVQTGRGTQGAVAVRITDDGELAAVYNLFMQTNAMMTNWYLDSLGIQPTVEDLLAHKDRVVFIRLDPTDKPTPPPLEADLWWAWLIAGGLLLGWAVYRLISDRE